TPPVPASRLRALASSGAGVATSRWTIALRSSIVGSVVVTAKSAGSGPGRVQPVRVAGASGSPPGRSASPASSPRGPPPAGAPPGGGAAVVADEPVAGVSPPPPSAGGAASGGDVPAPGVPNDRKGPREYGPPPRGTAS